MEPYANATETRHPEGMDGEQRESFLNQRVMLKSLCTNVHKVNFSFPDINDGVRVNIAPLQKAGLVTADVLAGKGLDKAIADRASWRDDERRWCREGKLPKPGWWE